MLSLSHTLYPLFHILFSSLSLSLSHQLSLSATVLLQYLPWPPACVGFSGFLCSRYHTGGSAGERCRSAVRYRWRTGPFAGQRCGQSKRLFFRWFRQGWVQTPECPFELRFSCCRARSRFHAPAQHDTAAGTFLKWRPHDLCFLPRAPANRTCVLQ